MIRVALVVFAGIALVVAVLSINNTFTITVAQRTRELALLRAVGASRRQVRRVVSAEAAVVGVVSSIVGVVAGLFVAGLLKGLFDAIGFSLPAGGLTIRPLSITAGVVVGIAATVIAARSPARRASHVSPLAALRDAAAEPASISRRRVAVGVAFGALGVGVLSAGTFGAVALVGIGSVLMLVATLTLAPLVARPFASLIRTRAQRHARSAWATRPGQRHAQPSTHRIDGHRPRRRCRRRGAVHRVRRVTACGHRRRGQRRVRGRRRRARHAHLRRGRAERSGRTGDRRPARDGSRRRHRHPAGQAGRQQRAGRRHRPRRVRRRPPRRRRRRCPGRGRADRRGDLGELGGARGPHRGQHRRGRVRRRSDGDAHGHRGLCRPADPRRVRAQPGRSAPSTRPNRPIAPCS